MQPQQRSQNAGSKKVKHFSYSSDNRIGKGYSSLVYRGCNQLSSNSPFTQTSPWPSRLSI